MMKGRITDPNDAEATRRRRSTANRTLTILKAALNHAWREGKTPSDDAWRRVRPFPEADAARVRYLTMDEARRLLHACDEDFREIVEAALLTGARYGELAANDRLRPQPGQRHRSYSHEQGRESAPCCTER
jgi:integrase